MSLAEPANSNFPAALSPARFYVWLTDHEFDVLGSDSDAITLLLKLRQEFADSDEKFTLSPTILSRTKFLNWGDSRFRNAIASLVKSGLLLCVQDGKRGNCSPSLYRLAYEAED